VRNGEELSGQQILVIANTAIGWNVLGVSVYGKKLFKRMETVAPVVARHNENFFVLTILLVEGTSIVER
jgi:hypothetical protein